MSRKPLFQNLTSEQILNRLCSYEAIRQLAANYSRLMDEKNYSEVAELFIPDVKASPAKTGRDALKAELEKLMTGIGTTILKTTTHSIDFQDFDNASGYLYAHGDIQMGSKWLHQAVRYDDRYHRLEDVWYFTGRKHRLWYSAEVGQNPLSYAPANWPETNIGLGDLIVSKDKDLKNKPI